jgi:hypothetical protein
VVEAFAAQGAEEAFRDRVRAGCPNGGADDPQVGAGEDGVECGGELAVAVADHDVVVEDSPHDRDLGFEHLEPGRAVRVAGPAAVAAGDAPGQHLSGAGAKQLPPPVPFGDLRPFVLGDHALTWVSSLACGSSSSGGVSVNRTLTPWRPVRRAR